MSKNVKYSTTQRTNLAVGCYRVKEPDRQTERILIIRDEDKAGDPVLVTELNDGRQIDVGESKDTNSQNSTANLTANSTAKKVVQFPKAKKSNKEDFDIEEEDFSDSDEDSDDPSWGSSKRKKKNAMKGKKRKRKY